jgi:spore maturation protein A
MLGVIITVIILFSLLYSVYDCTTVQLSQAALTSSVDAVELCIYLSGAMALWGGVLKVAERCGITQKIANLARVPLSLLFKGLDNPKALTAICMNVTANMLGLGNAATPLGITAMKELCKGDATQKRKHIATLILLNTASVQLIPITVCSLRTEHGAQNPWNCTLPTILTSLLSLACGLAVISIFYSVKRKE